MVKQTIAMPFLDLFYFCFLIFLSLSTIPGVCKNRYQYPLYKNSLLERYSPTNFFSHFNNKSNYKEISQSFVVYPSVIQLPYLVLEGCPCLQSLSGREQYILAKILIMSLGKGRRHKEELSVGF